MGPKIHQIDNVDRLPPAAPHADSAPWQQQRRWLPDWRSLAVLCGFALLLFIVGYFMFGRDIRAWIQYGGGDWVLMLPIKIGIGALAVWVVRSALLVNQRGYQVFIWNAQTSAVVPQLITVDKAFADRKLPVAAAVTISQAQPMPMLDSGFVDGEVVPEDIPAPIALTPDHEWLGWVDRIPHLMIAGRTEAGKTTLAEAVIAHRAMAGELLYVLDPHYQPGKWCGLPATGGGRGYDSVMNGLGLVLDELDQRYKDFDRGKKTEDFERLTVFIDEVPALVEWCFDGKRLRDQRWMSFAKQLGSEARKVRISVILMTQSPLVQDIQINTRMRENFNRIALGDQSIDLIREAREPRRSDLERLIEDRQYTATMEYRNKIYALDTSNVPSLARRHVAHIARPWQPQQPIKPVVSAAAQAVSAVSTSMPVPGALPASLTKPAEQIAYLAATTNLGTRAIRERLGCDYNLVVDIAGKVRGPRGAHLRAHYQSIA